MLAERISRITLSETVALKTKANFLRQEGEQVFDFSAGEPDFPTPTLVKEAGKGAIDQDFTHYTSPQGIKDLRTAIVQKYAHEYGAQYDVDEVIITVGAKQALYNATQVLFQEGDEVLLPSPYWVTFPSQIALTGAHTKILLTREKNHFGLESHEVEKAISANTRGLILNSPANPTGAVLRADELKKILDLAKAHNIIVLSDECYEKLVYDVPYSSASTFGKENLVVVNSFSKSYAMTGWRIGYALAPREIIMAMVKLQSHSTTHPSSIAQHAAVTALTRASRSIEEMLQVYRQRCDFVLKALKAISGLDCVAPDGGFYVFPRVSSLFTKKAGIDGSVSLAQYLMDEARVIVTPGKAFGRDEYLRLSFATPMKVLEEGLAVMKGALEALHNQD